MAFRFQRRPFLLGNTNTSVETVPYIRGNTRRDDATLEFGALVLPASLEFQIDSGTGPTTYTVSVGSKAISSIVTAINAAISGDGHRAFNMGGVVHIEAGAGGQGTYIKMLPFSGVGDPPYDASIALGFPRFPDPLALVAGGDRSGAPFSLVEQNPLGTAYAVNGEDVTAQVLNRAVDALAYNADHMHLLLEREIALPMVIELSGGGTPDPRLIADGNGDFIQVSLAGLSAMIVGGIGGGFSDRVYLGRGLTRLSTLLEIAQYFAITDQDMVEIISGGETVRVAAVTHGLRTVPVPDFPSESSPPNAPVPNVADGDWPLLDGNNLLGRDVVKVAAAIITEVEYRTAIRCDAATFITEGVVARDKAVIGNALVTAPFSHNGIYEVEQVIDEEFLFLRGVGDDRGELNPDDSNDLGDVTVSSGGVFAEDVYLTFQPPIPAGTNVRIVVGGGYKLGDMPMDQFLKLAISTSEEVDDLVQRTIRRMKGPLVDATDDFTAYPFNNGAYIGEADVSQELMWRRITLQGAYDGQGRAAGGGYFVQVDANAPEWNNMTPPVPTAGTVESTGSGANIQANNLLTIVGHSFELGDVGKQFRTTGGTGSLRVGSTFVIIDYLDEENVILEPGEYNPTIPPGGNYNFQILAGKQDGMPAAMSTHVLQSALYGRLGYVHQEDRVEARQYGHHLLAVRETDSWPTAETLSLVAATFATADEWVTLAFDPTEASNIRAFEGDSENSWAQSYVRITDTRVNDGWFICMATDSAGRVRLMNLDGTYPVFTIAADGNAHFYLPTQAFMDARPSAAEGYRIANLFFEDAAEWVLAQVAQGFGSGYTHLGVLAVDWRGASSGLVALINGPTWHAYKAGDPATGSAVNVTTFMPANGLESWHYGAPYNTDLSPSGTNPADALERGGWAGGIVAETWSMDGRASDPNMQGTALYLAQKGSDSALVASAWEQGGAHGSPVSPMDLTLARGKATAVISRSDQWSMQQSGAAEFLGGVYQWDPRRFFEGEGALHDMYGGTYTELSLGSRFSNSPISVANGVRYYTTAGGATKLSRLGQPGQVLPPKYTDSDFDVLLYPPDPVKSRSHKSSGFLVWDGTTSVDKLTQDPSSYIGQQIKLTADVALGGVYDGVYTIINVYIPAGGSPRYWVEVWLSGKVLPTNFNTNKAVLKGSRWHFANLDIESFAAIGTGRTNVAFSGLGVLASVYGVVLEKTVFAARRDYGNGGIAEATSYYWPLGPNSKMSRHPIANEAWHVLHEPMGSPSLPDPNLTDFKTGEIVFRVSGPTQYDISTSFTESFQGEVGGSIHVHWLPVLDAGAFTASSMYAYVKVTGMGFLRHYSYKTTLRLKQGGTPAVGVMKNVTVALVDAVGGSLISVEKTVQLDFGGEEVAVHVTFDSSEMLFDLREDANDALEDVGSVILRLGIGHTVGNPPVQAIDFYIFQAAVENAQRTVVAGHLVTTGAAISSGFELHTEAMDWKSYGPESAGPYGDMGYGDIRPMLLNSEGMPIPPMGQYVTNEAGSKLGFIDVMSPSTYWFRGRDDAAFLFLGAKFAPPTLIDGAGTGDLELNAVGTAPPDTTNRRGGQVGHIISLDPPHGSILSTLHVVMSIRPSINLLGLNGKVVNWGVFHSTDCSGAGPSAWALEGYVIELWRYSVLPTENSPQSTNGAVLGTTEVQTWAEFGGGFSELIHTEIVDLDEVSFVEGTLGSQEDIKCGEATPPTLTQAIRNENFITTKIDLAGSGEELKTEKQLRVDRRQYSYFVVIKAWGVGTKREFSTVQIENTPTTGLYGVIPFTGGFRWGIHHAASEPIQDAYASMTRFKFRGATLGCRYTRMNP